MPLATLYTLRLDSDVIGEKISRGRFCKSLAQGKEKISCKSVQTDTFLHLVLGSRHNRVVALVFSS